MATPTANALLSGWLYILVYGSGTVYARAETIGFGTFKTIRPFIAAISGGDVPKRFSRQG